VSVEYGGLDIKVVVVSFPEEPNYMLKPTKNMPWIPVIANLVFNISCVARFQVGIHYYLLKPIPYQTQELEIKKAAFLKSRLLSQGLKELPFDPILQKSTMTFEVDEALTKEWAQACILQHITINYSIIRCVWV
jgi:hypothetical protein